MVAYYAEMWWEFDLPEGEEMRFSHYAARFREGDLEAFEFPILEGRMCAQPDEVVVGYSLAREKNLHPGDNLTILLEGEPLTLPVVGVYRETSFLGHMLILPVETLYSVQPDASPFSYMLNLRPGADAQVVATALRESSNGLLEVAVTSEQDMPPELTSLQGVMAVLSLVLGGIAVVGVFNSVWMGGMGTAAGVWIAQGGRDDAGAGEPVCADRSGHHGPGRVRGWPSGRGGPLASVVRRGGARDWLGADQPPGGCAWAGAAAAGHRAGGGGRSLLPRPPRRAGERGGDATVRIRGLSSWASCHSYSCPT